MRAPLDLDGRRPCNSGRPELEPHRTDGHAGQLRVGRRPLRQLQGPFGYALPIDRFPGQPERRRPLTGDFLAEGAHGRRRLAAPQSPDEREEATPWVDADPLEPGYEAGVAGHDPEVGGEGEIESGSDRRSSYGSDGRHLQVPDPQEGLVDGGGRRR